jgi:hypothetical protein
MTGDRDEFPAATKLALALRAAHRCSLCKTLTVRPHSNIGKAVITGVAAHICAAAMGGPRFDIKQSPGERRAPANGIWVCHDCSDLIDKDPAAYPIELLRAKKLAHEQWVSQEDFVPGLPTISIKTYGGLVLPARGPSTVTGEMIERFRDHEIQVSTSSRHELVQLRMTVQLMESAMGVSVIDQPVGIAVNIGPELSPWVASASGGGSVTTSGSLSPSNRFVVEQETVIPGRPLRFILRTARSERLSHILGWNPEDDDAWSAYAEGTFLYSDQGQLFERAFVLRILQDDKRMISALPTEELGGQKRREMSGFGF